MKYATKQKAKKRLLLISGKQHPEQVAEAMVRLAKRGLYNAAGMAEHNKRANYGSINLSKQATQSNSK